MKKNSSKLSYPAYLILLPLNFFQLGWHGFKTTKKGWLIVIVIIFSICSYFFFDFLLYKIPTLLGEDATAKIYTEDSTTKNQTYMYRIKPVTELYKFDLLDKQAVSIVYPILSLLATLGIKNRKQRLICLISSFVCLFILLVIKNYYYFQENLEGPKEAFLLLTVSYYLLIFLSFSLLLSNFTFSKVNKAHIGFLSSLANLIGFIFLYTFLKRNTQIYDIVIIYSLLSMIINYYLLQSILTKPFFSISLYMNHNCSDIEYNVFISYRRSKNVETAKLIRGALNSNELKAFVDIEDLGPKFFDEQLIEVIQKIKNFILILSPDDLKKCSETKDWLRKEISTAILNKKNIIPICKDGFDWDETIYLPEDIKDLPRHNSIKYSTEYFDAMIMKIISFLEDTSVDDSCNPKIQKLNNGKFYTIIKSMFDFEKGV